MLFETSVLIVIVFFHTYYEAFVQKYKGSLVRMVHSTSLAHVRSGTCLSGCHDCHLSGLFCLYLREGIGSLCSASSLLVYCRGKR
jgi:hypothetical protein